LILFLSVPAGDAAADGVIDSMLDTAPRIVLPITPPERSPAALTCLSPHRQRKGNGDEEEDEEHEADDGTREAKAHCSTRVVRCARDAPSTR